MIGAGIMSATLAMLLKQLDPGITIEIHEMLEGPARESSNAWNNAGSGHAALCELNYTPMEDDGTINITRALEVNTEFDCSRQFWSWLVKKGVIRDPQTFIHAVPHCSFVLGADNCNFLKKRFESLSAHPLYKGMEYTDNKNELEQWLPLVMEGRDPNEIVAATRMATGTDVDYGELTSIFISSLQEMEGFSIRYNSRVKDLIRENGDWKVVTRDEQTQ